MRWNTYNKMSKSQKEEYDYRFRNRINIEPKKYLNLIFGFSFITMTTFLTSYILLSDDTFLEIREHVVSLLQSTSQLLSTGMYILLFFIIIDVGYNIYLYVNRKMWLRKNNIKEEPVWTKVKSLMKL